MGWEDDNGVYLVPDIAYSEATALLRDSNGLNGMSKNAIHKQLVQVGALASMGADGQVKKVRCGDSTHRVLHLHRDKLLSDFIDEE